MTNSGKMTHYHRGPLGVNHKPNSSSHTFFSIQVSLTPKVLGVFFIKTASKQPLFKARWNFQNWGLF
jgi:hypothetical protein